MGGVPDVAAANGAYSPRLTGRILAWVGGYGNRIFALDLAGGKRYLLAEATSGPTRDTALDTRLGQPWQSRVIWGETAFNPNGGSTHASLVVAAVP